MTFLHSTIYIHLWTNRLERPLPTKYQETTEQETSGSFQLNTSQATTTAWITLLLKSSALSITSTTRPRSLETRPGTSQSPPFATLPILSWIFLSSVPSFAATLGRIMPIGNVDVTLYVTLVTMFCITISTITSDFIPCIVLDESLHMLLAGDSIRPFTELDVATSPGV